MSLTENRKALTVGIFLAVGILIFIVGVFTLGGQQKSFDKAVNISAVFNDVSGLKKGNDVWFSGVKVGTISEVKFTGISQVNVKMRIDKESQPFIHSNSGARIGSDGLIGNKIVVIDGGSPEAPKIQNGDVLQSEKLLSTDDMLKTLQQNNQNLLAITGDFKVLSRKILQGKGTVGALMADSLMGVQLRNSMSNLQAITSSVLRVAGQLNRFSDKLNRQDGLVDKLLTDTVTFNRLKSAVTQLQKTASSASELTDNLNKASKKLTTTDNALGVLLNDPKGAVQVQTTLNNLQQSSIKLNDDLEAVQHNFLLKGFFKKKEKAKADSLRNK